MPTQQFLQNSCTATLALQLRTVLSGQPEAKTFPASRDIQLALQLPDPLLSKLKSILDTRICSEPAKGFDLQSHVSGFAGILAARGDDQIFVYVLLTNIGATSVSSASRADLLCLASLCIISCSTGTFPTPGTFLPDSCNVRSLLPISTMDQKWAERNQLL
ncbi:hypothetical protein B0H11DRAFT_2348266 [Mycena galericulata]|nr:hypothetical protein B0H11DRAFT_2348266 [Mycena galericulata]